MFTTYYYIDFYIKNILYFVNWIADFRILIFKGARDVSWE